MSIFTSIFFHDIISSQIDRFRRWGQSLWQDYSIRDLISRRRSVRTYDGTPLRAEDRYKLETYIRTLQNPFGVSVTFRISDAKAQKLSSPVVLGTDTCLGAKVTRTLNEEIALGYDFERFVLFYEKRTMSPNVICSPYERQ